MKAIKRIDLLNCDRCGEKCSRYEDCCEILETKELMEMGLQQNERLLDQMIKNFVERLERITDNIKNIANDKSIKPYNKPYKMIHEINWGIANMDFSGITERAGEYRAVERELRRFDDIFVKVERNSI
jgi:hypothetical protein